MVRNLTILTGCFDVLVNEIVLSRVLFGVNMNLSLQNGYEAAEKASYIDERRSCEQGYIYPQSLKPR